MQIARQFGNLNNYSIYQLNNKMGLAGSPDGESEQRILTQPEYDVIYPFVNGFAIVKKGSFYGVIDKWGNVTIPIEMPYIKHYWKEGYFHVSSNRLDGWNYNVDGYYRIFPIMTETEEAKSIIEKHFGEKPKWASFAISKQIIFVTLENKGYIYNVGLKRIIYDGNGKSKVINGDKIIVENKSTGKFGIIDKEGNVLVQFVYDGLFYCATHENYAENNLIEAKRNGKSGYIDFSGRIRIPFDYKFCGTFVKGTAWVSNEQGKAGLIDYSGRLLEPLTHDNIMHLKNGNVVFVDTNQFFRTEQYSVYGKPKNYVKNNAGASSFHFDVFHNPDFVGVETSNRKRGVTHLDGTIILPAVYDHITFWQDIRNDAIIVKKGNKVGLVNLNNKVVVDFIYDHIETIKIVENNEDKYVYKIEKNGKYGLLDNKFREIVPLIYNRFSFSEMYNAFFVKITNERALVNPNNEILIPFTSEYLKD